MTTGLEALDSSLETTNLWLSEIGASIGQDRRHSLHALLAVLTALRDCLPARQAVRLAADLPLLVRGLFYTGYHPEARPQPLRKQEEFVTLVAKRIGNIGPVSPRMTSSAVFRVLQRHLPPPLSAQVRDALPPEIRALFQTGPEGAQPGDRREAAPSAADHTRRDHTARDHAMAGESASRDWGVAQSGQDDDPHIRPDRLS